MTPILVSNSQPAVPPPEVPWRVLFWVALGLAIIGFADAAFLWVPVAFNEPTSRVHAIVATIDTLPLGTVAVAVMFAASASEGSGSRLGVIALISMIVVAGLVLLLVLYGWLAFAGGAESEQVTRAAMARTILFGAVYVIIYAVIAGAAIARLRERAQLLPRD